MVPVPPRTCVVGGAGVDHGAGLVQRLTDVVTGVGVHRLAAVGLHRDGHVELVGLLEEAGQLREGDVGALPDLDTADPVLVHVLELALETGRLAVAG